MENSRIGARYLVAIINRDTALLDQVKEKEARKFFRQIVSAIDLCHQVWVGG